MQEKAQVRDYYREQKEEAKRLAQAIVDFTNGCENSESYRVFAEVIACSHRTLQQATMRLMVKTIRRLAENNTDLRNEGTVKLAKAIVKLMDEGEEIYPLPFI